MSYRLKNSKALLDVAVHCKTPTPVCSDHADHRRGYHRQPKQYIRDQQKHERDNRHYVAHTGIELHPSILVCRTKNEKENSQRKHKHDLTTFKEPTGLLEPHWNEKYRKKDRGGRE